MCEGCVKSVLLNEVKGTNCRRVHRITAFTLLEQPVPGLQFSKLRTCRPNVAVSQNRSKPQRAN